MTRVQEGAEWGNLASVLRMTKEDRINKILELENGNRKNKDESSNDFLIPNDIDSRLDELISEIRRDVGQKYPIGNAGTVITDIEGVNTEIKAYSKINNSISSNIIDHNYSCNFGKENRIFETMYVNSENIVNGPKAFNRCIDTESKMLEDIAHQLGYNKFTIDESVMGNVYLCTERAPCPSCENVISQFKKMFPNVNIFIKYLK